MAHRGLGRCPSSRNSPNRARAPGRPGRAARKRPSKGLGRVAVAVTRRLEGIPRIGQIRAYELPWLSRDVLAALAGRIVRETDGPIQKRPRSTSTAAHPAQRRVAEARYRTTRPVADSARVGTLAAGARHPPLEKRMVDEFPPGTARNRVQEPQEGGHPRPLASVREPNRPGWDRAGRHERRLEAGYSWLLNRLPPVLFRDRRPGLAGNALPPPMINVASDVRSPRSDWPEHRGPAVRRAAIGRRAGRAPG